MASDAEASCICDPNFAVICSFLEKFAKICGITHPSFSELQEMLENTQEVAQPLVDLHVKLLRKARKSVSGERWEKALIKFCHTYSKPDGWEIERFGYKKSQLAVKLRLLKSLLEVQFDLNGRFKGAINRLNSEELRLQPIGRDKLGHAYWSQLDEECNLRVYREDLDDESWEIVARDREELVKLIGQLSSNEPANGDLDALLNEDSNSLEIEKPITDTGQVVKSPMSDEDDEAEFEEPETEDDDYFDDIDEEKAEKLKSVNVSEKKDEDAQIENKDERVADDQQSELQVKSTVDGKAATNDQELDLNKVTPADVCKTESEGILNNVTETRSIPEDLTQGKCTDVTPLPLNLEKGHVNRNILNQTSPCHATDLSKPVNTAENKSVNTIQRAATDLTTKRPFFEEKSELQSDSESVSQLCKKKRMEESDEVGVAIEEPLMLVRGEGSGKDLNTGNPGNSTEKSENTAKEEKSDHVPRDDRKLEEIDKVEGGTNTNLNNDTNTKNSLTTASTSMQLNECENNKILSDNSTTCKKSDEIVKDTPIGVEDSPNSINIERKVQLLEVGNTSTSSVISSPNNAYSSGMDTVDIDIKSTSTVLIPQLPSNGDKSRPSEAPLPATKRFLHLSTNTSQINSSSSTSQTSTDRNNAITAPVKVIPKLWSIDNICAPDEKTVEGSTSVVGNEFNTDKKIKPVLGVQVFSKTSSSVKRSSRWDIGKPDAQLVMPSNPGLADAVAEDVRLSSESQEKELKDQIAPSKVGLANILNKTDSKSVMQNEHSAFIDKTKPPFHLKDTEGDLSRMDEKKDDHVVQRKLDPEPGNNKIPDVESSGKAAIVTPVQHPPQRFFFGPGCVQFSANVTDKPVDHVEEQDTNIAKANTASIIADHSTESINSTSIEVLSPKLPTDLQPLSTTVPEDSRVSVELSAGTTRELLLTTTPTLEGETKTEMEEIIEEPTKIVNVVEQVVLHIVDENVCEIKEEEPSGLDSDSNSLDICKSVACENDSPKLLPSESCVEMISTSSEYSSEPSKTSTHDKNLGDSLPVVEHTDENNTTHNATGNSLVLSPRLTVEPQKQDQAHNLCESSENVSDIESGSATTLASSVLPESISLDTDSNLTQAKGQNVDTVEESAILNVPAADAVPTPVVVESIISSFVSVDEPINLDLPEEKITSTSIECVEKSTCQQNLLDEYNSTPSNKISDVVSSVPNEFVTAVNLSPELHDKANPDSFTSVADLQQSQLVNPSYPSLEGTVPEKHAIAIWSSKSDDMAEIVSAISPVAINQAQELSKEIIGTVLAPSDALIQKPDPLDTLSDSLSVATPPLAVIGSSKPTKSMDSKMEISLEESNEKNNPPLLKIESSVLSPIPTPKLRLEPDSPVKIINENLDVLDRPSSQTPSSIILPVHDSSLMLCQPKDMAEQLSKMSENTNPGDAQENEPLPVVLAEADPENVQTKAEPEAVLKVEENVSALLVDKELPENETCKHLEIPEIQSSSVNESIVQQESDLIPSTNTTVTLNKIDNQSVQDTIPAKSSSLALQEDVKPAVLESTSAVSILQPPCPESKSVAELELSNKIKSLDDNAQSQDTNRDVSEDIGKTTEENSEEDTLGTKVEVKIHQDVPKESSILGLSMDYNPEKPIPDFLGIKVKTMTSMIEVNVDNIRGDDDDSQPFEADPLADYDDIIPALQTTEREAPCPKSKRKRPSINESSPDVSKRTRHISSNSDELETLNAATALLKKKGRGRPPKVKREGRWGRGRRAAAERDSSSEGVGTDLGVDLVCEESSVDSMPVIKPKKTTPVKAKPTPKKTRKVLGLEIPIEPDETAVASSSAAPVRQSRRIAQIKIKEEAERREIEEVTRSVIEQEEKMQMQDGKRKKKSKHVSEDYTDDGDEDEEPCKEERKRKKRKKRENNWTRKDLNHSNPWRSSSGSSSSMEEEEEDQEPSDEEDQRMMVLKSDHEFSPESDLEDDGINAQPLRRARTARKESAPEEPVDEAPCQKCGKSDHPEWILLCDKCDAGWHCSCLRPVLFVIPEGDWYCPPCQHTTLIKSLIEQLKEVDCNAKKRNNEELRKKRLAYVGISLDNVLPKPEGKEDVATDSESVQGSAQPPASSRSSSRSSSSSGDDSEPVYQLRERRSNIVSYRFNEYDDLINSAIQDELEADKGAGNQGRGKDIANIIEAEREVNPGEKVPEEKQGTGDGDDADFEPEVEEEEEEDGYIPPVTKTSAKKKHRKLNSLDISSEDDADSDEDFKGSSSEDDDEDYEEGDSDDSEIGRRRGRGRSSGPVRRSARARTTRFDREFIDDDSNDSDVPVKSKKTRQVWHDTSDSEESDSTWGQRKKQKQKQQSSRTYAPKSNEKKKKKKKKKSAVGGSDEETFKVSKPKKPRIKFGGLDEVEEDVVTARRTRGQKINYVELAGTDSEEEFMKVSKKIESEDEYVMNEEEELMDLEEEGKEESDNESVDDPFATDPEANPVPLPVVSATVMTASKEKSSAKGQPEKLQKKSKKQKKSDGSMKSVKPLLSDSDDAALELAQVLEETIEHFQPEIDEEELAKETKRLKKEAKKLEKKELKKKGKKKKSDSDLSEIPASSEPEPEPDLLETTMKRKGRGRVTQASDIPEVNSPSAPTTFPRVQTPPPGNSVISRMLQAQPVAPAPRSFTDAASAMGQKYFGDRLPLGERPSLGDRLPLGARNMPPTHRPPYLPRSRHPLPYRQPRSPGLPHFSGARGPPPHPNLPGNPMYHTSHHPMDPSPSGGGPITIAPTGVDSKAPLGTPPPPYSRGGPPPLISRFTAEGLPATNLGAQVRHPPPLFPSGTSGNHLQARTATPPGRTPGNFSPYHQPPNYHYGAYPSPGPIGSDDTLPPPAYQGTAYPEAYATSPLTASDGSNSKPVDEEGSGEFGGLVSYFSSQREDDLDA